MAIPADVQAALARLLQYNSNPVSASNPYGMGDYGNLINFPLALADVSTVADWFGATGGLPGPQGDPGANGTNGTNGTNGADGNDGWSPVLAVVVDGARRVQQVVDWAGGEGTKPATGKYVGATGLVTDIASAVDIRGASGSGTGDVVGPNSSVTGNVVTFGGTSGKSIQDSGVALGTAASKNTGTSAGQVPVLDSGGKLATSTLPTLGTASAKDVGTSAGQVPLLDGGGKIQVSVLPDAVLSNLKYQTGWNAATNTPAIPAASDSNKGWYYIVKTAGTTTIDGVNDWQNGDWIVSNGSSWDKIDNTDQVISVAGLQGVISAAALKTALALVVGMDVQAYDANTAKVNIAQSWGAVQRSAVTALISGATISIDAASTNDYSLTLANNATLANFTNAASYVGKKGSIAGQQDGTGGRTLAYGANWFAIGSATAPSVPTAANAKFRIDYHIVSSTRTDFSVSSVGV
ncbi:hypothetical protein [Rhizobium oryzicola]|uniref:Collagen-like protein n=1 Tax=Rhizobium oryzicola TaxID=1232668 RepID=A0ABT8SVG8_9HYPH|nr:hypothetical protein [Rhizobium oryzicola]MDO1582437.1 hypothetical protein [Rhizobium oryzicola]